MAGKAALEAVDVLLVEDDPADVLMTFTEVIRRIDDFYLTLVKLPG